MSLTERKVIITCGTGGVGKTTLSAALAMQQALRGRKTVVVTIDPAKRLATSLGLEGLEDKPREITPLLREAAAKAGLPAPKAGLYALMPDTRSTLEQFFRSVSPSKAVADKLIQNPIFEIFAREFSGTNEYMALERLDSLVTSKEYDCVILDTPPNRNTLAFLNAPQLLARLFDEGFIKWLVVPANHLLATGMKKAIGLLENLTGEGFIKNLIEFAGGLVEMQSTFTAKVKRVSSLLQSSEVGFVLVTGPTTETLPEFEHFMRQLDERKLPFEGVFVNRTLGSIPLTEAERKVTEPATAAALKTLSSLQDREKEVTARLKEKTEQHGFFIPVPELSRDIHSIEDLLHVSHYLDRAFQQLHS
jgi:anion-transporting  ArsA/GET3 family ATPase